MAGGRYHRGIDAAHSIGQEINLSLNKADPDFWTSVCTPLLALSPELRLTFIVHRIASNGFMQSGRAQSYIYVPFRCFAACGSCFPVLMNPETNTL
jgi:hypothetical protein